MNCTCELHCNLEESQAASNSHTNLQDAFTLPIFLPSAPFPLDLERAPHAELLSAPAPAAARIPACPMHAPHRQTQAPGAEQALQPPARLPRAHGAEGVVTAAGAAPLSRHASLSRRMSTASGDRAPLNLRPFFAECDKGDRGSNQQGGLGRLDQLGRDPLIMSVNSLIMP